MQGSILHMACFLGNNRYAIADLYMRKRSASQRGSIWWYQGFSPTPFPFPLSCVVSRGHLSALVSKRGLSHYRSNKAVANSIKP